MKPWKTGLAIAALLVIAVLTGAQEVFEAVKSGDLSRERALMGNDASPVGAKNRSGNEVDAKIIDGFRQSATWRRGPFTGEGRLLSEGRIFAMAADDLDCAGCRQTGLSRWRCR
jgi:hypothetical protein